MRKGELIGFVIAILAGGTSVAGAGQDLFKQFDDGRPGCDANHLSDAAVCLNKIEEPKSEDPVDQCNYIDAYMRCFKEECCKEKKLLDAIETLTKFATDQDLPCTTITCGAAAALQANLILTAAAILLLTLSTA